jgi:hypothetical protein
MGLISSGKTLPLLLVLALLLASSVDSIRTGLDWIGTLLFCDGCRRRLRLRVVVTRTGLVWLGPLKGLKICSPFWMPFFGCLHSPPCHIFGHIDIIGERCNCVGIRRQSLRFARLLRRTDFPFFSRQILRLSKRTGPMFCGASDATKQTNIRNLFPGSGGDMERVCFFCVESAKL